MTRMGMRMRKERRKKTTQMKIISMKRVETPLMLLQLLMRQNSLKIEKEVINKCKTNALEQMC